MVKLLQDPEFLAIETVPAARVPKRKQGPSRLPKLMAIEAAPDIENIVTTYCPIGVLDKFQKADPELVKCHVIGTVIPAEVAGPKPAAVSTSEVLDDGDRFLALANAPAPERAR